MAKIKNKIVKNMLYSTNITAFRIYTNGHRKIYNKRQYIVFYNFIHIFRSKNHTNIIF